MIEIVDPNPQWPTEFLQLAERLKAVLSDTAVRVDHIGSTSVPGLAAKDVIDIQVTVADLSLGGLPQWMQSCGFVHRPKITHDLLVGVAPDSPELSKMFFKQGPGERPVHVHVREIGRLNQRYALLFRDYLVAHPAICDAYAQIKKELARKFPHDEDAYYAIKDPYMDTVYYAASEWATQSGWQAD
ncbi:hypothetical protein C5Y96_00450 [Blastopirellula marina]|uniref:GrpB family protein n=1 Tax=Blastopirellula marina TaxID=124 RepID=A0A2S8GA85_9BACT|nr:MULTISPECIES: GrpB family protein [Pirellulaceae]PQO41220.1 hypothetical protein C5Y96_00450 [Blastopirellula marina]RCS56244.1 GrpB family protein [Bremerella cremea]